MENVSRKIDVGPEADAVRLAFALRATGKLSVREIGEALAGQGVVNGKGKPFGPGTLWKMLRNPAYSGLRKQPGT